jgi:hypothetical protein
MKTAIAILLLSLAAFANAFTGAPSVGKAVPRLSEQRARNVVVVEQRRQQQSPPPRDREGVVLSNMLREYANYNDVWDGDGGYGGYGMGRGVYSRRSGGGYGGGYG